MLSQIIPILLLKIDKNMKKIFSLLFAIPLLGFAQNLQGEIRFKEITKFEVPEEYKQYMTGMPDSLVKETILLFNEEESIYKNFENLDAAVDPEGGQWWMMWFNKDVQTYKNFKDSIRIEKQDFMDKIFLITDKLQDTSKWKITPGMETILGYQCMKATTMRDSLEVTAWFTTQIPQSSGPSMSGGLPGMILKVEVPYNGGRRGSGKMTIIADKVTMREVSSGEIGRPKKGKQVTRDEYNEIVRQKMKEMRESDQWGR